MLMRNSLHRLIWGWKTALKESSTFCGLGTAGEAERYQAWVFTAPVSWLQMQYEQWLQATASQTSPLLLLFCPCDKICWQKKSNLVDKETITSHNSSLHFIIAGNSWKQNLKQLVTSHRSQEYQGREAFMYATAWLTVSIFIQLGNEI